jgi:hypothetical protein
MTIQHQSCPHCGIRRTVSLFGQRHCFNCRNVRALPFTPRELQRLRMYRGAVRAGIYSDWPVFA